MTLPLWLIPVLPLAGFAVNGLLGTRLGKSFVTAVGVGAAGLATLAAYARLLPFAPGDHAHGRRARRELDRRPATSRSTSRSGSTRSRR